MGILYLVRHGQASFLKQNYDKLSPLGEGQARLLGDYWARRDIVFDRVAVGPRERQRDTVNLVRDAYRRCGVAFPEPREMPEFDEYQGEAVLKYGLTELLEKDQGIRGLHAAFQSSSSDAELHANFQRLYSAIIGGWVRGAFCVPGLETWQEFGARVNAGWEKFLREGGRGERVAVFTSGGPIAMVMRRALHLSAEDTLELTWMSRNTSWSEFFYSGSGERFTLSSFNSHAHIEDPAMLSYR
jgi:broad specificity phosphatase PhoE